MLAVLPKGVPVLPVGGIRPESMAAYRQAGAAGLGLGSALYKPGDGPAPVRQKALAVRQAFDALRGTAPALDFSSGNRIQSPRAVANAHWAETGGSNRKISVVP